MASAATQACASEPVHAAPRACKHGRPPGIECKISKNVSYNKYMRSFNMKGSEPPELFDMKRVRTSNNPVLFSILSSLGGPPGCAYNVNGIWYQFHIAGVWANAVRVAQVVVEVPTMAPRKVRYVDIIFS